MTNLWEHICAFPVYLRNAAAWTETMASGNFAASSKTWHNRERLGRLQMTNKPLRQVNNRYQDYPAKVLGHHWHVQPHPATLTLPWWDAGENQGGGSEKSCG